MSEVDPNALAQAERYLAALAALAPSQSLLDVRYIAADGEMARFFLGMHAPDRARQIVQIGQRTDVYVGCAPRRRRSGRRDALAPSALVWVDCDTPEATSALRDFMPRPSMIITSGTEQHAHGYWMLAQMLSAAAVKQVNCALATAIGSDTSAVTEPTAILRVPGTLNFKQTPPQPVRLEFCSGRRYLLAQIAAAAPLPTSDDDKEPVATATRDGYARVCRPHTTDDPLLAIAPSDYVRVLLERTPGRDHKVACPFHEDRKPSLHVYPTAAEGWTCFGCKTNDGKLLGGDIYTLASRLWGIPASGASFFELRERLDEVFGVARG